MATMSPLRRRMIEDMTIRNLSHSTQQSYIYAVAKFSRKRCELPRQPGCYARVLKRVGIQYCRISSTTAGMSL